jgi:DNA-directed RNA polymerase subunit RPC12/RpoP
MANCSHPNTHMTYKQVKGGVEEYIVCTSCGHRTFVAFHPDK